MHSLTGDIIDKAAEDQFYDVKLLVNGVELEPIFFNNIMDHVEKFIDSEARNLVKEKLEIADNKSMRLQELIKEAIEKYVTSLNYQIMTIKMEDKSELIDHIDFHDHTTDVFFNPTVEENKAIVCWQARNPNSFYMGVVYMNNETGKITYPEGAVIPKQTERDREMLPKFVIIGKKEMDDNEIEILLTRLEKQYLMRNVIRI
jgi:hypothetical protein